MAATTDGRVVFDGKDVLVYDAHGVLRGVHSRMDGEFCVFHPEDNLAEPATGTSYL